MESENKENDSNENKILNEGKSPKDEHIKVFLRVRPNFKNPEYISKNFYS